MKRLMPVIVVAAAAATAAGCGGGSTGSSGGYGAPASTTTPATAGATAGTLSSSVGPEFDISMNETAVAAGSYTLNVDDQSTSHNFHLSGPGGVDVKTDVSGTGKKTFTVTLQNGSYKFVCDAHPSVMHGTLTVN
jgi:plastocyanin